MFFFLLYLILYSNFHYIIFFYKLLACILSNPCPTSFLSGKKKFGDRKKDFTQPNNKRRSILSTNENRTSNAFEPRFCFCGKSQTKSSLSWVECCKCQETFHGVCVGFSSQEELNKNTEPYSECDDTIRICDESRCPFCQYSDRSLINSRATLIVTPTSILNQWEREISRHTSIQNPTSDPNRSNRQPLKVLVYRGVKEICSISHSQALQNNDTKMLNPLYLVDTDGKILLRLLDC